MTCDAQWDWPLEIEALDPYPFHGLVYSEIGPSGASQVMLQPSGGRPPILRPARPVTNFFGPSYSPLLESSLWDVGMPDPPPSDCLWAAGAESLGRTILAVVEPQIRVNGVTRRVNVSRVDDDGLHQLRDVDSGQQLATFAVTAAMVFSGKTQLRDPRSGQMRPLGAPVLGVIDRSPDGTRRLYRTVASGTSAFGGTFAYYAGVIELQISADTDWNWSVEVIVRADLDQCLGQYSYYRAASINRTTISRVTGQLEFEAMPPNEAVSSVDGNLYTGSLVEIVTRTGRIVSAWFGPDGAVQYMRADYEYEITDFSDPSGSFWIQTPDWSADRWLISRQRREQIPVRLYTDTHELRLTYDETFTAQTDVNWNSEGIPFGFRASQHTRGIINTPAQWSTSTNISNPSSPGINTMSIAALGARPDVPHSPDEIAVLTNQVRFRQANTESQQVRGFFIQGLNLATWLTPVLSRSGVVGALTPITPSAVGGNPERALYNPLTNETARAIDLQAQGKGLIGWL